MSADNGIYIARFPTKNGAMEYRVVECTNIEDCDHDPKWPIKMTEMIRVCKFGNAKTFSERSQAILFAHDYSKEFDILEYGVSEMEFSSPLPEVSVEEATRWLDGFWKERQAG